MKTILFSLITICAFFASADIASVATQLGGIAESGMNVYSLEGETLEQLAESLQYQVTEEKENEIMLNYKNIQSMDEIVWGTTNAKNFSDLLFSAIHFMDDDANANQVLYSTKELSTIQKLLGELKNTDVIYSWNPNGDSVCGQLLTTPVLIDVKTKTAYELNFYKIEGC